jgi:hypothetical protein
LAFVCVFSAFIKAQGAATLRWTLVRRYAEITRPHSVIGNLRIPLNYQVFSLVIKML